MKQNIKYQEIGLKNYFLPLLIGCFSLVACNSNAGSSESGAQTPSLTLKAAAKTNTSSTTALNCSNPCGPQQLIECSAQEKHISAEAYFNKYLFNQATVDSYCRNPRPSSDTSEAQKQFHAEHCKNPGKYFSYSNFIAAASNPKFATFLCDKNTQGTDSTSKEQRYKSLAAFFATIAQETTGVATGAPDAYTTDGLQFRFEKDYLANKSGTHSPFPTTYADGARTFWVAVDRQHKNLVYTKGYWGQPEGVAGPSPEVLATPFSSNYFDLTKSPMHVAWTSEWSNPKRDVFIPSAAYHVMKMVDVVESGYWIGMGAKQLTGNTLMSFFGWYNNNLVNPPVEKADINKFIADYLADGKLGYEGGIWFWMYRTSGKDLPTIADTLKSSKNVCHDVAIVTRLVNGGCNDDTTRNKYYNYFYKTLTGAEIIPVEYEYTNAQGAKVKLNSMQCSVDLQAYCYAK